MSKLVDFLTNNPEPFREDTSPISLMEFIKNNSNFLSLDITKNLDKQYRNIMLSLHKSPETLNLLFIEKYKEYMEENNKWNKSLQDDTEMDIWHDKLDELVESEFPDFPFSLALPNEQYLELDKPFTDKETIFIVNKPRKTSYEFSHLNRKELNQLADYLKICSKNQTPITLRQVLNAISESDYYRGIFRKINQHIFLEGFTKDTKLNYSLILGS